MIHYVDEEGNTVAADFIGSYQYQKSYSVRSPEVAGYTPNYTIVSSDENGMPAKNVEVTVTYYKKDTVAPADNTGNSSTTNNITNNTYNITNNTTTNEGDTYNDNDDDDDDSESGYSSTSKSTTSNNDNSGSGNTGSNRSNNNNGNADNNTAAPGTAAPAAQAPAATGTRSGSSVRGNMEREAHISLDEDGNPTLVSASDTETPLMNLGLGDHACNVLRFLILLAAFGVAVAHTNAMKKHQSRIFELKEKLEEAKK